jgi:predicted DNA-binding mobile mystery protein A
MHNRYMKSRFKNLKQSQLDAALARWRAAELPARPPSGWIKAIREALGMPAAYLAKRLGVVHSSVIRLESSEASDTISLGSLRRAAEALGCELHYALVPKQSLAQTLETQAGKVARERMGAVAHTMALEAQATSAETIETQVKELSGSLLSSSRRELWR